MCAWETHTTTHFDSSQFCIGKAWDCFLLVMVAKVCNFVNCLHNMAQTLSMSEAGRAAKPNLPRKPIFMVTAKTGCVWSSSCSPLLLPTEQERNRHLTSPAGRLGGRTHPDLSFALVPTFKAHIEPTVPTPTDVFWFSRSPSVNATEENKRVQTPLPF